MYNYNMSIHLDHNYTDIHLNPTLVKQQNCTSEDVKKIKILHRRRLCVFEQMSELDPQTDQQELRRLADEVQDIEFELQDAWGFKRDAANHTWWWKVPHCKCPKLDNHDRYGIREKVISGDCVIHGGTK